MRAGDCISYGYSDYTPILVRAVHCLTCAYSNYAPILVRAGELEQLSADLLDISREFLSLLLLRILWFLEIYEAFCMFSERDGT